mmetsp:Transcript_3401/g.5608  ORF Transcript_3401/g.5608 Transcript_3401/m.5608 type:complete len:389 (-) Transcript_3401:208-1374(-)
MAPKKRPAAAAPATAPVAKKPAVAKAAAKKSDGSTSEAKDQAGVVKEVLLESEVLADSVKNMLAGAVMHSLVFYKDCRHETQSKVVDMLGSAMETIEKALEAAITEATAKLDEAKEGEVTKKEELTKAEEGLEALAKEDVEKEQVWTEADEAVNKAKEAVETAEAAETQGNKDLEKAEAKKATLETVMADIYTPIKEGTAENLPKMIKSLMAKLKEFSVSMDGGLMETVPAALSKAKEDRGDFDKVVFEQLDSEFGKLVEKFNTILAEGGPGKAERAAAVETAKTELATAEEALKKADEESTAAAEAKTAGEAALKAAKKAAREAGPALKKATSELKDAEAKLDEFKEGPLAAFKSLAERSTPPPEPEGDAMATEEAAEPVPETTATA